MMMRPPGWDGEIDFEVVDGTAAQPTHYTRLKDIKWHGTHHYYHLDIFIAFSTFRGESSSY